MPPRVTINTYLPDSDYDQAAATRRRIMAEVAETGELIGGHHLDFPGIGHVIEDD